MEDGWVRSFADRLQEQVKFAGQGWCGSWAGRHACTYIERIRPCRPGEYFDREWGFERAMSSQTRGSWVVYAHDDVRQVILERARIAPLDREKLTAIVREGRETFEEAKGELRATLEAGLAEGEDATLRRALGEIEAHPSHVPAARF